jgi:hypothetical protein
MIWGALGMLICEFIVAIIGVSTDATAAVSAMIAFICIYVMFFATTVRPFPLLVSVGCFLPIFAKSSLLRNMLTVN